MSTPPEPLAASGDTLPEFPAVGDPDSDAAGSPRRNRRRFSAPPSSLPSPQFRRAALEIVLDLIDGLLP